MMVRTKAAAGMLAVGLLLGCGAEPEAPAVGAPPVVVTPVTVRDLEERIEATGELQAQDEATIASEVAGRVTAVIADEGDPVEAGAVLLEIDPERRELELADARARLAEAAANLREQRREHARIETLHAKGVASESQLDQAATGLALARSRHEAALAQAGVAERTLRDASVKAPFPGTVGRRQVSRGEFVQVGQPLFELVALDPVEVEFHVAERDSARVDEGQTVEVRVAPYPGEVFHGTVRTISPTIDARTRTLRVEAEIPNPEGRLRPGLFARVDLGVAQRADVMLVPEEAVLQRADGQIVYRTGADNRVERVAVTTGEHHEGLVEIASGLRPSDAVVTRGQAALVDGSRVSPRHPDGTPVTTELSSAAPEVAAPR